MLTATRLYNRVVVRSVMASPQLVRYFAAETSNTDNKHFLPNQPPISELEKGTKLVDTDNDNPGGFKNADITKDQPPSKKMETPKSSMNPESPSEEAMPPLKSSSSSSDKEVPANVPKEKHKVETESLDLVMLQDKVAVVLGATGEVGATAVKDLLDGGAKTVVFVADSKDKMNKLKAKFPEAVKDKRLVGVLGSYDSKSKLEDVLKLVKKELGDGVNIDHVVSSLGYTSTSWSQEHPLTSGVDEMRLLSNAFRHSMLPSMWATDVFFPVLRDLPDTSFTLFNDFYPEFVRPETNFTSQMINDAFADALTSIVEDSFPKRRGKTLRLRRALRL